MADRIAFTIAYILKILYSSDPQSASKHALECIQRATPSESTHFDPELVSLPFSLKSGLHNHNVILYILSVL